jgi:hypothetical protein
MGEILRSQYTQCIYNSLLASGSIPNLDPDPPGKPQLRAMYISQILSGFADRVWERLYSKYTVC